MVCGVTCAAGAQGGRFGLGSVSPPGVNASVTLIIAGPGMFLSIPALNFPQRFKTFFFVFISPSVSRVDPINLLRKSIRSQHYYGQPPSFACTQRDTSNPQRPRCTPR